MKKSKITLIVGVTLVIVAVVYFGVLFLKKSQSTNVFAYSNRQDGNKLYVRDQESEEGRLLVDVAVINACASGEWVYYIPGNFEGIFKVKADGTENTKISSLEYMEPLNNSMKIESSLQDGYILYELIQLKEEGDLSEASNRKYKLNLKNNSIE